MNKKISQFIKKHKVITGLCLIGVLAGGYFGLRGFFTQTAQAQYTVSQVEKGVLIVSVSGSGQVATLDQFDIKPKTSGTLIGLYLKKDQAVKQGALLAILDDRSAKQAVFQAQIALDQEKIKLNDLLSPDGQSLAQAQNDFIGVQRDLEKAQAIYDTIEPDTAKAIQDTYDNGYSDVSSAFFKLADYIQDLKDVLGTSASEQANVDAYKLLLGRDSVLVQRVIDDYTLANNLYNQSFASFHAVFQDSDKAKVSQLISDTLKTTKAVSQALESDRHMYDAITGVNYKQFSVASLVDKMKPQIESDLSGAFSLVNSLQNDQDAISQAVKDGPGKIVDAKLALSKAQVNLVVKKQALDDLKSGANSLDVRAEQNAVLQKEMALSDAKEKLFQCYIVAPFNGIVSAVNVDVKVGDSISSGVSLGTVITKQQVAEITLNEVDVSSVKAGQKATISFDAIDGLTLTGKVADVDTSGLTSQGVVSYGVKIIFDQQNEQVKPGMSLTADIITQAKQDVLLVPNSAIKQQNDSVYVQVVDKNIALANQTAASISSSALSNNNLQQQTVEIGLSNDTMTEIVSGLQEGDYIVTQTITAQSSNSSTGANSQQRNSGFGLPGVSGGGAVRQFSR